MRLLAAILLAATLVLGFLGYPPKITAQTVEWRDPTGLPALNGNDATGRAVPVPLEVRLDGSYPVSVSTTPTLVWRGIDAGVGQVRFEITTLAERNARVLWSQTVAVGADRVASARVPAGVIGQGRTYGWTAVATANAAVRHGPFALTVDVQRSGAQPVWTYRDLAVTEGTGELVYAWKSPELSTLAGPLGWTLVHRPTNTPSPGLPEGWRLAITGTTAWEGLRLNEDGSVTLATSTGGAVTYVKRGDQWEPQVGRFNSAGETTLLAQNADGTFSATDGNRTVTVFARPTDNAIGRPVRVWVPGAPTVQQQWRNGRLRALVDPVTDNAVGFYYGGDEACVMERDPGFAPVPDGKLCGVIDWAGNAIFLEYVDTPTGPQIGRIVRGLGLGPYAQSWDIGWDDSGRIVEVRDPFTTTVVASGAVDGLGVQDTRVLTQVAYDAQGRVQSLKAPASLIAGDEQPEWRLQQPKTTFSYAPFTVDVVGDATPMGFNEQTWLDPVTLQVEKRRDESGNVITYAYDGGGQLVRTVDQSSGTVTEMRYNRYGQVIEQLGPTKGALTSPTAPRTTTQYDQDEQGRDWKGLAARYWANAGFNGVPASGTTGPVLAGGTAPVAGLSFNWPTSPAGTPGPWAARLTGTYEAPQSGAYAFTNTTAAKLWVNGKLCASECTTSLAQGNAASLQIDVVSPDGAAAGVNVLVTTPDGKRATVPTAQLRPNYGLVTSSTVREHVTGAGTQELVTRMVYDPVTTQLLKTIAPSGATQTRSYEPYNPANGQWGRSTAVTDASGKTTTSEYYAPGAVAFDCQGQAIEQDGQIKSITTPGGTVVSQVGLPAGGTLAGSDGVATACSAMAENDLGVTTTTTGLGAPVSETVYPLTGGNPLVTTTVTKAQGTTETTRVKLDTNGNAWWTKDASGTTTVTQWDPLTAQVERVVETTADGQTRTMENAYTAAGQIATVTVNGHRLITNEYAANGTLRRTVLGNGAVQTFELDANNNARKATTTFPDGTVLTETQSHSPTGRLLARTISGPTGTSTFAYAYNKDGRLVDTTLTGSIPAKATAWHSEYAGPEGLNGNRASKTWTRADGSQETTEFAYGADNRLLSASRGRIAGALEYDAAGRATKVGGVTLAYDAAGQLLSAADGDRTYTFTDQGSTTTLTRTVDGESLSISATASGETLVLGADKRIDAQVVSPAPGIQVVLDQGGAPVRWIYDDMLGNATWTSKGDAAPTRTHLYAPGGEPISVERASDPRTPIDLVLDSLGWASGTGASTLRLSAPLTILGARVYTPDGGRWLQPDPDLNGSFNAYEYAIGDPINHSDPTGNITKGQIAGMVVAVVVGVAIGALTFGIGTGATAAYGYAAIASQMALGAVAGALSGAAGEVITQTIDNGGVVDWSKVGWGALWGGIAGGVSAGISGVYLKVIRPGRYIRDIAESRSAARNWWTGQVTTTKPKGTLDAYKMIRAGQRDDGTARGFFKEMFTKKRGFAKRAGAPVEFQAGDEVAWQVFGKQAPKGSVAGLVDDANVSGMLQRNGGQVSTPRVSQAGNGGNGNQLSYQQSLKSQEVYEQVLDESVSTSKKVKALLKVDDVEEVGKGRVGSVLSSEQDFEQKLFADYIKSVFK